MSCDCTVVGIHVCGDKSLLETESTDELGSLCSIACYVSKASADEGSACIECGCGVPAVDMLVSYENNSAPLSHMV